MYGVVLMVALSGAGEAPQCWHHCGCHGGCYGCYGCSCYGGCYGCSCYGCSAYSYCHGWRGSCYGCSCACSGGYGYYAPVMDAPVVPPGPPPAPPAPPMPPGKTGYPIPSASTFRTPATIQVSVPAQAVLYFDGVKMTSSSESRRFSTPPLENGKSYFYSVKAEVVRDGQTITTTQHVVVRAGQQTQVQVNFTLTGSLVARQD